MNLWAITGLIIWMTGMICSCITKDGGFVEYSIVSLFILGLIYLESR
jgi:hypothetical protein